MRVGILLVSLSLCGAGAGGYAHGFAPTTEPGPGQPNAPSAKQASAERGTLNQMMLLNDRRELSVGDRLRYEVLEEQSQPELVFVNSEGDVRVPLIGPVPAQGKTCQKLAFDIKKELENDFFIMRPSCWSFARRSIPEVRSISSERCRTKAPSRSLPTAS